MYVVLVISSALADILLNKNKNGGAIGSRFFCKDIESMVCILAVTIPICCCLPVWSCWFLLMMAFVFHASNVYAWRKKKVETTMHINFKHKELFSKPLSPNQYSHFHLVRTRLTRNFGLHTQNPLVQNQIALTHILYRFG